jgi:hypothetical protein
LLLARRYAQRLDRVTVRFAERTKRNHAETLPG